MMNVQSRSGPGWPAIRYPGRNQKEVQNNPNSWDVSANSSRWNRNVRETGARRVYGSSIIFRYLVGWRCSPYAVRSENQTGSSGRQRRKRCTLNTTQLVIASVAKSANQQKGAEMEHPDSIWRNNCHAKYID